MIIPKSWLAASVLTTVLSIAVAWPGWAQHPEIEFGNGVICDTVAQIEEFAAFDGGDDEAAEYVNQREAHACAIQTMAYIKGGTVKEITVDEQKGVITEITVLGWFDGERWKRITPLTQYTIFPVEEQGA
jgi:hypothetical protein